MEIRVEGYIGQESGLAALLGDGTSFSLAKLQNSLDGNTDNLLKVQINSGGGSVTEGFAIHDALRASKKSIETEVLGLCGSIATIIALAAPKGKRHGHKNSEYFIHNPFWQPTAPDAMEADDLQRLADELKDAQENILNFYVEETGADKEVLRKYMNEKKSLTMEQAKELGFIDVIIGEEVKAKKYELIAFVDTKKIKMEKQFTPEQTSWLEKKFSELGATIKNFLNPAVKAQIIELENGTKLFIEAEDGVFVGKKILVEDKSAPAPDGTHKLKDGRELIVKDGTVTEVKETPPPVSTEAKLKEEIEALTKQLTESQAKVKEFEDAKTKDTELVKGLEKELGEIKNMVLKTDAPKPAGQTFKGAAGKQEKSEAQQLKEYRESKNKKN